jgi:FeS assembly SUF system protein
MTTKVTIETPENVAADKGGIRADSPLKERVIYAIRTVMDPEIPVNLYDLGLIYKLEVGFMGAVEIEMTLTAPNCPVAGDMPGLVRDAVMKVEGVSDCRVKLVFDPPWDKSRLSEAARLELGLF